MNKRPETRLNITLNIKQPVKKYDGSPLDKKVVEALKKNPKAFIIGMKY